ncbi:MAG: hypothetical protein LBS33_04050 [Streptococcaceae bacterium]|nr:hypothetical protein [Streptococcaceae bacterium]
MTIPSKVELQDDTSGIKGTKTVTNAVVIHVTDNALKIANGKKLTVAISTEETLKLTNSDDNLLGYTVKLDSTGGTDVSSGTPVIAQALAGANTDVSATLYFETTSVPKYAGTYQGTLNFTINPNAS